MERKNRNVVERMQREFCPIEREHRFKHKKKHRVSWKQMTIEEREEQYLKDKKFNKSIKIDEDNQIERRIQK